MPRKSASKRTSKKRATTRRRIPRTRLRPRHRRDVAEWASLSVNRTLSPPSGDFDTNQLYSKLDVKLNDFPRAVQVAEAYQHFRIKKVTFTFKTYADTFTSGGPGRPNLYWLIDKSGSVPRNLTLEQLKQMGCKPHACDNKPYKVSYTPSVLTGVSTASLTPPNFTVVGQSYRLSPWLSTSDNEGTGWAPSVVEHLGLYWYMEQTQASQIGEYLVDMEVQFQFKKPLIQVQAGAPEAIKTQVAEIDNSPDGIVGGPDGQSVPLATSTL